MMDRLRFDILLDALFRSLRAGQLHDPRMREAILADLRMIAGSLTRIAAELEADAPKEE